MKKNKVMFISFLIIGLIPLFVICFTFPNIFKHVNEPVVFTSKDFEFKHSTTQDDEIVYVYELSLGLKFKEDVNDLTLSCIFENTNLVYSDVPKEVYIGDFSKGEEDINVEIILEKMNYNLIDVEYKIEGQEDYKYLQNGEIVTTIIIVCVMGFVFLCLIVNAVRYAKRMSREDNY